MFRTVRGFLLVAPPAFLLALVAYLWSHPRAAEAFTPYPFLVDALGRTLGRRPVGRFAVSATVFFLVPYLVSALLLFLSDLGLAVAGRIWRGKKGGAARPVAPEGAVTFAAATLVLSAVAGKLLHRVAHGGELPGGVNVAPIFVAAVPFVAAGAALLLGAVATLPRALASRLSSGTPLRATRSEAPRRGAGGSS